MKENTGQKQSLNSQRVKFYHEKVMQFIKLLDSDKK